MFSRGVYPDVGLKEARERALERSIEHFQTLSCPKFEVRLQRRPQSNALIIRFKQEVPKCVRIECAMR